MGTFNTNSGRQSGADSNLPSAPNTPAADPTITVRRGEIRTQTAQNLRQRQAASDVRGPSGASILEGSSRVSDNRERALGIDRRAGTPDQRNASDRARQEQAAINETMDEREEILEESGGSAERTEELGDDANEEIQVLKKTLEVLYSFDSAYTSGEFLESLVPRFVNLSGRGNRSPGSREALRQIKQDTRKAGSESILLARTSLKAGKRRLKDYKALTSISEPSLKLSTRQYNYKPKEFRKLEKVISAKPYPIEKLTEGISLFLQAPQFERVEGPMMINKFEIENQLRLSPIDDAPINVQSDSREPPALGSYLQQISPDTDTFTGVRRADSAQASRFSLSINRTPVGGGETGDGTRDDVDTGLIRGLDRDRIFRQQEFGASSELEEGFDTRGQGAGGVDRGSPTGGGGPTGGGPSGGGPSGGGTGGY